MKGLTLILFLFVSSLQYPYKQQVHQDLTKEGYYLLRNFIRGDISVVLYHLDNNPGSPAWTNGSLTTEEWREDIKDIVWNSFTEITPVLQSSIENNPPERKTFIYTGIGISEIVYFGLGFNFMQNYSVTIKTDLFPLNGSGEGIRAATGIGIRFSKLFYEELLKHSLFPLDNLSLEYSQGFLLNGTSKNIGKFQFTTGSDKINKSGFNFCWAIGFAIITEKDKKPLALPNLRIGVIYNF